MCTVVRELPPGSTVVACRCNRAECESGSAYRLVTERALLVWIVMDSSSSRGFTALQITDHHRSARRACQHHEALCCIAMAPHRRLHGGANSGTSVRVQPH